VTDTATSTLRPPDHETVRSVLVRPDGRVEEVNLSGDDPARFAKIKLLVGARSITAIVIGDQDGPAAMAWIDEFSDRKGLARNVILSALVDRPVFGTTVITGFGEGDRYSMTSVAAGLQRVLERMARDTSGVQR
jgi:hypothetical protein